MDPNQLWMMLELAKCVGALKAQGVPAAQRQAESSEHALDAMLEAYTEQELSKTEEAR